MTENAIPKRSLGARCVRAILKALVYSFYRLELVGQEHFPKEGGALMLANHVSWVDALIIGAPSPRDVRYVAAEEFFKPGFIGGTLRLFNVIPISTTQARQAIKTTAEAVNAGAIVCLFPEGFLSRTGTLNELQKGFELIIRQSDDVPILPVYLDRLWGSIFSFSEGKFFFKIPRRLPYPITVNVGALIPAAEAKRDRVRDALMTLGVEAYRRRPELNRPLAHTLVRALKRRPDQIAFVDYVHNERRVYTRRQVLAFVLTCLHAGKPLDLSVLPEALNASLATHLPSWALLRNCPNIDPDTPSAVLSDGSRLTQHGLLTEIARITDVNLFHRQDVLLNTYPPDTLAGQLFGIWLPLLAGLKSVRIGAETNLTKAITDESVTCLVSDTRPISNATSLRQHLTFSSVDDGADDESLPLLLRGWISPSQQSVVALSLPDVVGRAFVQKGHKSGSVGRLLPGTFVKTDSKGALIGHTAATTVANTPLGSQGHLDADGFLYLNDSSQVPA